MIDQMKAHLRSLAQQPFDPFRIINAGKLHQDAIIAQVQCSFGEVQQRLVDDGVRIEFEYGWGLIRKSVTEEALTFRFEGGDRASLEAVVANFISKLGSLGDALREQYEATVGS